MIQKYIQPNNTRKKAILAVCQCVSVGMSSLGSQLGDGTGFLSLQYPSPCSSSSPWILNVISGAACKYPAVLPKTPVGFLPTGCHCGHTQRCLGQQGHSWLVSSSLLFSSLSLYKLEMWARYSQLKAVFWFSTINLNRSHLHSLQDHVLSSSPSVAQVQAYLCIPPNTMSTV